MQKKAIQLIKGPCLILAGAGSGKTSVIINKIINLITKNNVNPKNILAVTFTNKAAKEIKNRLINKLSINQINKLMISTFHAFGLKFIRKEFCLLNIKSNFIISDATDQLHILKKITDYNFSKNKFLVKNLFFKINFWKNNLLKPEKLKIYHNDKFNELFLKYYQKYSDYLRSHDLLDFNDLIYLPTLLLKKNKLVQERWKKKIKYLLVDEYQDTSFSQYQLIKNLSGIKSNFTLVGDDNQSIYSWRGANLKNFCTLKEDYPSLKIIKMEQNYRSSGCILQAANSLISYNLNYFKKKLYCNLEYGKKINIVEMKNEFKEAKEVVNFIKFHKLMYKLKYKDYAILFRNNYQVKVVEMEFINQNIPYYIYEGNSFFKNFEIKDLLAYLRLIINPHDDLAFLRIINIPNRRIGLVTLNKLKMFAYKNNMSLLSVSYDPRISNIFKENIVSILNNFFIWINQLKLLIVKSNINILEKIITDIKYINWINKTVKDKNLLNYKLKNISFFSDWFKKCLLKKNSDSIHHIEIILGRIMCGEYEELNSFHYNTQYDSDKVQLMTLHSSKGLEFSIVFIIGIEEGILPHHKSILEEDISEERRLMYVGITRAKSRLLLSFCKKRYMFGIHKSIEPSRFLFELPKSNVCWSNSF